MKNIEESDNFMNVDRISTLIDGIFAIAMTILILSIEVPIISGPVSNKIIESSLNAIIFPFLSFFFKFYFTGHVLDHQPQKYAAYKTYR